MRRYSSDCCFHTSFKVGIIISLVAIGSMMNGCSSALYKPTPENVTSDASLQELQEGRKLYLNKCGGCHTLILPEKHNAKQWKYWVDTMQVKAKINPAEKELILKYLKTNE